MLSASLNKTFPSCLSSFISRYIPLVYWQGILLLDILLPDKFHWFTDRVYYCWTFYYQINSIGLLTSFSLISTGPLNHTLPMPWYKTFLISLSRLCFSYLTFIDCCLMKGQLGGDLLYTHCFNNMAVMSHVQIFLDLGYLIITKLYWIFKHGHWIFNTIGFKACNIFEVFWNISIPACFSFRCIDS